MRIKSTLLRKTMKIRSRIWSKRTDLTKEFWTPKAALKVPANLKMWEALLAQRKFSQPLLAASWAGE